MDEILDQVVQLGWEFSLSYRNKQFSMVIFKPEWITDSPYASRICPNWKTETLRGALQSALDFIED